MVKNSLYYKCISSDIPRSVQRKGYTFFEKGLYNLNLIAIRKNNDNAITNKFDDMLVVIYKDDTGWRERFYNITTEPGDYYMRKKLGNPKGTAILVPDQYRGCFKIGKHKGQYDALVQAKPVKVYRDGDMDEVYDMFPQTIQEGFFGINIHRSNQGFTRDTVDMYSAGCQVFSNSEDFNQFMELCKKSAAIYGNSFTYTLIDEKDLEYSRK